ncbi:hypothetical protein, partial [Novosphingobium chloroacetimidivorans]|uniref:hypothetical protein n=1 Tax=Novosphingobium chloroacetimidivorans TaxID=1428314 RepID=UPI001C876FEC
SAVAIPASCSFKIAMICSSLNLLRFIPSDSFASDSTQNRSHFRGARHHRQPRRTAWHADRAHR